MRKDNNTFIIYSVIMYALSVLKGYGLFSLPIVSYELACICSLEDPQRKLEPKVKGPRRAWEGPVKKRLRSLCCR